MSTQQPPREFVYRAGQELYNARMMSPGPICPDFNPDGEWMKRLIKAKQENGPEFWSELRAILQHDLDTLPMERFKVWGSVWTIPIISRHRIHHYIETVLAECRFRPALREVLKDNNVGLGGDHDRALLAVFDDFPTTMNRIQAMAHLLISGFDHYLPQIDSIVEIGAGIGELTDVCYKLGYNGSYTVFDFPELHLLQSYHHSACGLDASKLAYITEPDQIPTDIGLVIATWSLTEMPIALRDAVLDKVAGAKNLLLAYSSKIFGYDNDEWINTVLIPRFPNASVEIVDMPYMPWDGGTKYVFIKNNHEPV